MDPQQLSSLITMLLMFAAIYFILFMPQRRKEKKVREMQNSLAVGNTITTIGGLVGKIINIKDDEITIESSVEKTQIILKKWAAKEVEKPIEM